MSSSQERDNDPAATPAPKPGRMLRLAAAVLSAGATLACLWALASVFGLASALGAVVVRVQVKSQFRGPFEVRAMDGHGTELARSIPLYVGKQTSAFFAGLPGVAFEKLEIGFGDDTKATALQLERIWLASRFGWADFKRATLASALVAGRHVLRTALDGPQVVVESEPGRASVVITSSALRDFSQQWSSRRTRLLAEIFVASAILMAAISYLSPLSSWIATRLSEAVVLSALFIGAIVFPQVNDWVSAFPDLESTDQRVLARKPRLLENGSIRSVFPEEYEQFFNDNMTIRNRLVRLNSIIRVFLLHHSPVDDVVVGKDGWLFYAGEGILDYTEGRPPFSDDQIELWQSSLRNLRNTLSSCGVAFYFVAVPNTQSIYPDRLPDGIVPAATTRRDQLYESLHRSGIDTIDIETPLLNARDDVPFLYSKVGTHWNGYGAFIAMKSIVQRLSERFAALTSLNQSLLGRYVAARPTDVGLLNMLSLPTDLLQADDGGDVSLGHSIRAQSHPAPSYVPKSLRPVLYAQSDSNLPKAIILRDSFGIQLAPLMAEAFQRSLFLWSWRYTEEIGEIVRRERPDVVIWMIVERALQGSGAAPPDPQAVAASASDLEHAYARPE
ncbi:MAG: hypothetical protein HYV63_03675 [Candidatus Schekmanbacteria bacterium]|nr:hypothetical protein [Candidatus Schekmanbacteria bacterium]